ncbi:MAG: hypothetical protein Q8M31_05380 [Beijerinckiaceae bacterium]|nr:hypothetical protein [Beijerinckiaceae bacterium]
MSDGTTKEKSRYSAHYEKFILKVDNQRKASFKEREAAVAAGQKIVEVYKTPRVVIIDRDTNEEIVLSGQ